MMYVTEDFEFSVVGIAWDVWITQGNSGLSPDTLTYQKLVYTSFDQKHSLFSFSYTDNPRTPAKR